MLNDEILHALNGDTAQGHRTVSVKLTIRDRTLLASISAIAAQGAASAGSARLSMNSLHADGSMGMLFCWAVPNFGWGTGEF